MVSVLGYDSLLRGHISKKTAALQGTMNLLMEIFTGLGRQSRREIKKTFSNSDTVNAIIHDRLVKPSGMKLKKIEYAGEKIFTRGKKELSSYLPHLLGPLHPALARLFLTRPTKNYHELGNHFAHSSFLRSEKRDRRWNSQVKFLHCDS